MNPFVYCYPVLLRPSFSDRLFISYVVKKINVGEKCNKNSCLNKNYARNKYRQEKNYQIQYVEGKPSIESFKL